MSNRTKYYKKYLLAFFKTRIVKTIWFNFKMFPVKEAVKMPIFLYGNTTFRSLEGTICINSPVFPGMIKIGKNDYYVDTAVQHCIWTVNGTIVFNGPVSFGHGSYVLVSRNSTLTIGSKGTYFGSNLKIMCFDNITIGNNVRVAWDCQFMDTSFHYVELLKKENKILPLTKPIIIGDRVWIGNRTTVSKGTVIPDDTIVTSNSLVNKDFSLIEPYSMLAGSPASLKGSGFKRVFDEKIQKELDSKYNYERTHL